MKAPQVTIKDIARQLGISPSTVSRALKDHPDINPETKRQVHELAGQLHYRPNAIALSLRSRNTFTIGVIIPEIVHHFFSTVISGIETVAYNEGYNVILSQSNESFEQEVKGTSALFQSRVDGLLVSVAKETERFEHFAEVIEDGVPIVFFDRIAPGLDADRVIVDDFQGAYNIVEHLIQSGCKRIAHLAAPQNLLIGRNRQFGYIEALRKYHLPVEENLIIKCDNRDEALEATKTLLGLPNPPDGIFAVNDLTASGAITVIRRAGLKIPEDIAIAGFGDGLIAQVLDPQLTTIEQHGYEIGEIAAKLLFQRIKNPEVNKEPVTKLIRTHLVVRESSQHIPLKKL
jgi:DNA-binding LacI/PurR family transcriptional regulator